MRLSSIRRPRSDASSAHYIQEIQPAFFGQPRLGWGAAPSARPSRSSPTAAIDQRIRRNKAVLARALGSRVKRHARCRGFAHIAEHHRCTLTAVPHAGRNIVDAIAVNDCAFIQSTAETASMATLELLTRVLREIAAQRGSRTGGLNIS